MVNINMFEFKHPKYYKELRKRNKSDQAISDEASTEATSVRPGPGLKELRQKSSSVNQQDLLKVSSIKLQAHQATSRKPQALSNKPQASSRKLQAP